MGRRRYRQQAGRKLATDRRPDPRMLARGERVSPVGKVTAVARTHALLPPECRRWGGTRRPQIRAILTQPVHHCQIPARASTYSEGGRYRLGNLRKLEKVALIRCLILLRHPLPCPPSPALLRPVLSFILHPSSFPVVRSDEFVCSAQRCNRQCRWNRREIFRRFFFPAGKMRRTACQASAVGITIGICSPPLQSRKIDSPSKGKVFGVDP